MDLSIIIVNWNSKDFLRKCAQSIYATVRGIEFEIVVVDGASYDGCGEMLAKEFPKVKFVQADKNLGFARANNLAYEHSTGEVLLFLNPDTEVHEEAVAKLRDALLKVEGAGIVGARLLNSDGTLQMSAVQSFPTLLNQFLDSEPLRRAFPRLPLWGIAPLYDAVETPLPGEVLSGACLMMRRDTFERAGRFSQDFFMYAEDLDLCHKVRALGLKPYYVPTARIIHHGGGSTLTGRSTFSDVMMKESVYRLLVKVRGKFYGECFRLTTGVSAVGRLLLLILMSPVLLLSRGSAAARAPFRKWTAILKWAAGMEKRLAGYY